MTPNQEDQMPEATDPYVPTGDVDKLRVTMHDYVVLPPAKPGGKARLHTIVATDYVRPDFLEAYLADARAKWPLVEVSEEPDAGPGGYHGVTHVPEHLDHPLAGETFAATKSKGR